MSIYVCVCVCVLDLLRKKKVIEWAWQAFLHELRVRDFENLYNPAGNRGVHLIPYSVALVYHEPFSSGIILSAFVNDLEVGAH